MKNIKLDTKHAQSNTITLPHNTRMAQVNRPIAQVIFTVKTTTPIDKDMKARRAKAELAEAKLTDLATQWQGHSETALSENMNNGWDNYVDAWIQAKDPTIKFNVETGMHSSEKHYNATKKDGTKNSERALRLDDSNPDGSGEAKTAYELMTDGTGDQLAIYNAMEAIVNIDTTELTTTHLRAILTLDSELVGELSGEVGAWVELIRNDILDAATANQKIIVKLLCQGIKVKDIAQQLGKSDKAIYASISSICFRAEKYLKKV